MAKRGADNELTKDDHSDDERDRDEADPGVRTEALRPVEGRVIRGMPKRRGLGQPTAPSTSAFNFAAPNTTATTSSNSPFSGFSLSSSSTASSSTTSTFTPPTSNPFSGFSLTSSTAAPAPGPSPANSTIAPAFGSTQMDSNKFSFFGRTEPAVKPGSPPKPLERIPEFKPFQPAPSTSTTNDSASGSSSSITPASGPPAPFKAFSFGANSNSSTPAPTSTTPAPAAAPVTASVATGSVAKSPFSGFSFNNPTIPPPAASPAPSNAPNSTPTFSFGNTAAVASPPATTVTPASAPAPAQTDPISPSVEPTTKPSSNPQPSQSTPPSSAEVSYYTALRGLNTSILTFLQRTIESDELVDLSSVLPAIAEQYKIHLDQAADKAGWRPAPSSAPKPVTNGKNETNGTTPTPAKTPVAPAAMPSVGGFSLLKAPTPSTTTPVTGGFVPQIPASSSPSSPFSFGAAKKPSTEVSELVKDVLDAPTPAPMESTPAKPSTTEPTSTEPSSGKKLNLFSFSPSKPLQPTTPQSKIFTPSSSIVSAIPTEPQVPQGKFIDGKVPNLAFGGVKSTSSTTTNLPTALTPPSAISQSFSGGGVSFGFGSASKPDTSFSAGNIHGESGNSAPTVSAPFKFGSTFGNSTSTTNATSSGFTFGSTFSSSSTPTAGGSSMFPSSTTRNFFKPSATPTPTVTSTSTAGNQGEAGNGEASGEGGGGGEDESAPGATFDLAGSVGAGEEGEETVVECRAALSMFSTDLKAWSKVGTGQLKLKRGKEGKRRLLMRADGSGRVLLNTQLDTKSPEQEGKRLKFTGFTAEGVPTLFMLQTKEEKIAGDLVEKIGFEIQAIKDSK